MKVIIGAIILLASVAWMKKGEAIQKRAKQDLVSDLDKAAIRKMTFMSDEDFSENRKLAKVSDAKAIVSAVVNSQNDILWSQLWLMGMMERMSDSRLAGHHVFRLTESGQSSLSELVKSAEACRNS